MKITLLLFLFDSETCSVCLRRHGCHVHKISQCKDHRVYYFRWYHRLYTTGDHASNLCLMSGEAKVLMVSWFGVTVT